MRHSIGSKSTGFSSAFALFEAVFDERVAHGVEQGIKRLAVAEFQCPVRIAILDALELHDDRRTAHSGPHLEQALQVDGMRELIRERLMPIAGGPAAAALLLLQAAGDEDLLELTRGHAAQHRGEEDDGRLADFRRLRHGSRPEAS